MAAAISDKLLKLAELTSRMGGDVGKFWRRWLGLAAFFNIGFPLSIAAEHFAGEPLPKRSIAEWVTFCAVTEAVMLLASALIAAATHWSEWRETLKETEYDTADYDNTFLIAFAFFILGAGVILWPLIAQYSN